VSQGGTVIWITGLPASGKSTLAARLRERIEALGRMAVLLDGDAVREALVPRPGYSPEERDAFYQTLARLAGLLARQGLSVLVAATAPRRAHRDAARALAPRFVEVFVDVPAEECARRDPKGLWARARAGEAPTLPGAGAPYEPPEAPEVRATGGEDAAAVEAVLRSLADRKGAPPR
jgi:adenylylsulfate kinase